MAATSPRLNPNQLLKPTDPAPELALREAVRLLTQLVREASFVEAHILPLLHEQSRRAEGWYLAPTYQSQDNSY